MVVLRRRRSTVEMGVEVSSSPLLVNGTTPLLVLDG